MPTPGRPQMKSGLYACAGSSATVRAARVRQAVAVADHELLEGELRVGLRDREFDGRRERARRRARRPARVLLALAARVVAPGCSVITSTSTRCATTPSAQVAIRLEKRSLSHVAVRAGALTTSRSPSRATACTGSSQTR